MASDTFEARIVAELHIAGAYTPKNVEISALATILTGPASVTAAETAIRDVVENQNSPVIYANDAETAVSLELDPEGVFKWIERRDPNEFPPSMG